MSKKVLETERLILREFDLNDAPFIHELLNSPGWLKYIGDRKIKTLADALDYLANVPLKSYRQHSFGLSMIELKETKQAVGMCGIIIRDYLAHPDIGYALLPQFEGNGYAVEITSALLQHAGRKWDIKTIYAITTADNIQSKKVLSKIGMKFQNKINVPGDEKPLDLYSTEPI